MPRPVYFPGSAVNFSTQCWLQKWYVVPAWANEPAAVAGSTVMPQTGSIDGSAASRERHPNARARRIVRDVRCAASDARDGMGGMPLTSSLWPTSNASCRIRRLRGVGWLVVPPVRTGSEPDRAASWRSGSAEAAAGPIDRAPARRRHDNCPRWWPVPRRASGPG